MYKKLRSHLKEQNITILELSRRTKIAPGDLCSIFTGNRPLYPGWRKRIAEALALPEEEVTREE